MCFRWVDKATYKYRAPCNFVRLSCYKSMKVDPGDRPKQKIQQFPQVIISLKVKTQQCIFYGLYSLINDKMNQND